MRAQCIPPLLDTTKRILECSLSRFIPQGRNAAEEPGEAGPVVIDGTVGNGHDTLFLARLVGEHGHVYGFDVQEVGLACAHERLQEAGVVKRVTLLHAGHETLEVHIPAEKCPFVCAAMYNLGYLPGSDKATVTRAGTTIASLEALLPRLRQHGVVTIHIYTGHEGGVEEGDAILAWSALLDWKNWRVARSDFMNKTHNRETLLVIERLDEPGCEAVR